MRFAPIVAAAVLLACRETPSDTAGGAPPMQPVQLAQRLASLDAEDENGLASLTDEIVQEDRRDARAAVRLWVGGDPAMSRKALVLLSGLHDLAAVPLLESQGPLTPEKEAWLLATVADAQIQLRSDVVRRIDLALADRRPVPLPEEYQQGGMEETPPPRRVCDEAYALMRRMTRPDENEEQYQAKLRAFLELVDKQKDAEIKREKSGRAWRRLTEEE